MICMMYFSSFQYISATCITHYDSAVKKSSIMMATLAAINFLSDSVKFDCNCQRNNSVYRQIWAIYQVKCNVYTIDPLKIPPRIKKNLMILAGVWFCFVRLLCVPQTVCGLHAIYIPSVRVTVC